MKKKEREGRVRKSEGWKSQEERERRTNERGRMKNNERMRKIRGGRVWKKERGERAQKNESGGRD